MNRVTNVPIVVLNPLLMCKLCGGYLIDATTVIECLHSFCRSCIITYLKFHTTCPICDTLLHKTRPHYAIRRDRVLQSIVYKLIPRLFEKEMLCRRSFYEANPIHNSRSLSPEKRGEISLNTYVLHEEDRLSIELQYWNQTEDPQTNSPHQSHKTPPIDPIVLPSPFQSTFLLCPPDLTVGHLEKLIRMKFNLKPGVHDVSVFFTIDDLFSSDYTLSDLACLYAWRRLQPLKLYFAITESPKTSSPSSQINSVSRNSNDTCGPNTTATTTTITTTTSNTLSKRNSQDSVLKRESSGSANSDNVPSPIKEHTTDYKISSSWDNSKSEFRKTSYSPSLPTHSFQPSALSSTSVLKNTTTGSVCSPRA